MLWKKVRNNQEYLKLEQQNLTFEELLLPLCFQIQGKEKQKIHFTNANTDKGDAQAPCYDKWRLL